MQLLRAQQQHHFVTFHNCAHGGDRDKANSLWVNDDWLDELAILRSRQHKHKPWTAKLENGGFKFSTSEETAYPHLLFDRVVTCLKRVALQQGAHLPDTILEQAEGPAREKLSRIILGALPRGHKVKPLVAEFGTYLTVFADPQQPSLVETLRQTAAEGRQSCFPPYYYKLQGVKLRRQIELGWLATILLTMSFFWAWGMLTLSKMCKLAFLVSPMSSSSVQSWLVIPEVWINILTPRSRTCSMLILLAPLLIWPKAGSTFSISIWSVPMNLRKLSLSFGKACPSMCARRWVERGCCSWKRSSRTWSIRMWAWWMRLQKVSSWEDGWVNLMFFSLRPSGRPCPWRLCANLRRVWTLPLSEAWLLGKKRTWSVRLGLRL